MTIDASTRAVSRSSTPPRAIPPPAQTFRRRPGRSRRRTPPTGRTTAAAPVPSARTTSPGRRAACCAGHRRPDGLGSRVNGSVRRSARSAGFTERTRAAASSMASGNPSRRRHSRRHGPDPGRRDRNRAGQRAPVPGTAPPRANPARIGPPARVVGAGRPVPALAGQAQRLVRLVASTTTPGPRGRSRPPGSHPVETCSQLSSTSKQPHGSQEREQRLVMLPPGCRCTPSTVLSAGSTAAASVSGANSHHETPSGNRGEAVSATRSASRVFPTPPTPVSVTSRDAATSAVPQRDRMQRPTNDVISTGIPRPASAALQRAVAFGPANRRDRLPPPQEGGAVSSPGHCLTKIGRGGGSRNKTDGSRPSSTGCRLR